MTSSAERQWTIVDRARREGKVLTTELAASLHVASETVRRDLLALERRGLVRRVHGAAYPVEGAGFESSLEYRSTHLIDEKQRIARATVTAVEECESLFLDEGFLPLLVARALAERRTRPLTVLTSSLPAAAVLAGTEHHSVLVLGGRVRGLTMGTSGQWAVDMLQTFVLDAAVVGANGVSPEQGATIPEPDLMFIKRTAMDRAARSVLIGTSSKFDVTSFVRFAAIADFDTIITDDGLTARRARTYEELGPCVIRV